MITILSIIVGLFIIIIFGYFAFNLLLIIIGSIASGIFMFFAKRIQEKLDKIEAKRKAEYNRKHNVKTYNLDDEIRKVYYFFKRGL